MQKKLATIAATIITAILIASTLPNLAQTHAQSEVWSDWEKDRIVRLLEQIERNTR